MHYNSILRVVWIADYKIAALYFLHFLTLKRNKLLIVLQDVSSNYLILNLTSCNRDFVACGCALLSAHSVQRDR